MKIIAGYGTYIGALALICYAIGGAVAGKITYELAIPMVILGFTQFRQRMATTKVT